MNWKQACLSAALLAGAMIAFPDRAPAQPAPGQETGQACLQASERPCGSWTVADRMPASRYRSATSGGSQLGIYRGGWHEDLVRDFEQWLGREAAFAIIFTGDNGWSDWGGSLAWVIGQWPRGRKLLYSVPLIPKGASLEQAALGAYNDHYMAAARVIA